MEDGVGLKHRARRKAIREQGSVSALNQLWSELRNWNRAERTLNPTQAELVGIKGSRPQAGASNREPLLEVLIEQEPSGLDRYPGETPELLR